MVAGTSRATGLLVTPRRGQARGSRAWPTGESAYLASTAPVLDSQPLLRLVIRVPFLGRLVVPARRARGRASRNDLTLACVGPFLLEPLEHRDPVLGIAAFLGHGGRREPQGDASQRQDRDAMDQLGSKRFDAFGHQM